MKRYCIAWRKFLCLCAVAAVFLPATTAQISKEYFFAKGTNELIDSKYAAAIESFNLLLKIDTAMYDAYFRRAIAKYNLGDAYGALSDFSKAISINPVFTFAYFYRAVVRNAAGYHQEALKDLDEAASLRPQFSDVYYIRGISYFYLQQFSTALENYNAYLARNPNSAQGYTKRGVCRLFLKDTAAAIADYDRAITLNLRDPDGFSRRGCLYAAQGKNDFALKDFNQAIALDTTNSLNYYFRALAYYDKKEIKAALKDLERVLALDPYNALVYYNRALILTQTGDYSAAIADYNRAAEINPNNVLIYYNRAAVLLEKGNFRSAIADYTKAIDIYPDFANAYLNRSFAKRRTGDLRGAKADYDIAQRKIAEHQRKMEQDSSQHSFADTSRQYGNLVAFDADFGNREFTAELLQYQRTDITLQPLYRLSVGIADSVEKDYRKTYYNDRFERWKAGAAPLRIAIVHTAPSRTEEQQKQLTQEADHTIDSLAYHSGIGYFAKAVLLAEGNMYSASANFYRQAMSIEPENPFYHFAYSVAQSEMIDFVSSIENQQTTSIVMGANNSATLQSRPAAENRVYEYTEAIEELDKTIALMPSFAYAYYNRGNLYCNSNKFPEAIEDYSEAIRRYPYLAAAYYNRGLIQIYLRDTRKGCLDMSKAGELGVKSAYNVIKRYCKPQ